MSNNKFYKPQNYFMLRMFPSDPKGSLDVCLQRDFKAKGQIDYIQVSSMALRSNAGLPLKNHKTYKHFFVNNSNILPGDLRRLPDDCFSHFFINSKGDLI